MLRNLVCRKKILLLPWQTTQFQSLSSKNEIWNHLFMPKVGSIKKDSAKSSSPPHDQPNDPRNDKKNDRNNNDHRGDNRRYDRNNDRNNDHHGNNRSYDRNNDNRGNNHRSSDHRNNDYSNKYRDYNSRDNNYRKNTSENPKDILFKHVKRAPQPQIIVSFDKIDPFFREYSELYEYINDQLDPDRQKTYDRRHKIDYTSHEFTRRMELLLAGKSSQTNIMTIPEKLYYQFDENSKIPSTKLFNENEQQFFAALNILRFWHCKRLPFQIFDSYLSMPQDIQKRIFQILDSSESEIYDFKGKMGVELSHVYARKLQGVQSMQLALKNDYFECIEYLIHRDSPMTDDDLSYLVQKRSFPVMTIFRKYAFPKYLSPVLTKTAAEIGDIEMLTILHQSNCPWDESTTIAAAKNQHILCLRYAHENGCPMSIETLRAASLSNNIDCFIYAHRFGAVWCDSVLINAIKSNFIECLQYCWDYKIAFPKGLMKIAIENKRLQILEFLFDKGYEFENNLMYTAIATNNYFFVEFIHKHQKDETPSSYPLACRYAIQNNVNNNLGVLKFLHEHQYHWNEKVCEAAASKDTIDHLQYCYENGCPWNEKTSTSAATAGSLICLKYAHENGCPWNNVTSWGAAKNGHLECLKYLHENGCPLDIYTCKEAANGGHLDCLKYLHENGCPWDERTCHSAARNGHLTCLDYAHKNGCPWTPSIVLELAISSDNANVLKYAIENDCPIPKNIYELAAAAPNFSCLKFLHERENINPTIPPPHESMKFQTLDAAVKANQLKTVEYLIQTGYTPNKAVVATAIELDRFEIIKYLYEQCNIPLHRKIMDIAVKKNEFEFVKYLHQQKCPWNADTAAMASAHGNYEILKYLHENGCPWDHRVVQLARNNKSYSIVEYARFHNCPGADKYFSMREFTDKKLIKNMKKIRRTLEKEHDAKIKDSIVIDKKERNEI